MVSHAGDDAPQTPTQRRKPRCTTCGMPMLGHKRGLCQTPAKASPSRDLAATPKNEQRELTAQLKGLQIDAYDDNDEDEKKEVRVRRRCSVSPTKKAETLGSLASTQKAALDVLGRPGMMTDKGFESDDNTTRANIEKWLESVPRSDTSARSNQKRMSSSAQSVLDELLDVSVYADASSRKGSAKRLGRTSSFPERERFLDSLAEKSKKPVASVFTVEMSAIHELEEKAKRLKFHARMIAPTFADGRTGDGWLVIGKDKSTVDAVFRDVEREVRSDKVYVSAAVGAIAAWMYLAFS